MKVDVSRGKMITGHNPDNNRKKRRKNGHLCTIDDCVECQSKHPADFKRCKNRPTIEKIEEHKKQKEHDHKHCCCGHHHEGDKHDER